MTLSLAKLRLSVQTALIGRIWPDLRAVFVQVFERVALVYFYHHGILEGLDRSLYEEAMASLLNDIKHDDGEHIEVIYDAIRVDVPYSPPHLGACVYMRYESSVPRDEEEAKYWASLDDPDQFPREIVASHQYLLKSLKELTSEDILLGVRLITQDALVERVPPALRAVAIMQTNTKIQLRFFFHGPIKAEEKALLSGLLEKAADDVKAWEPTKDMLVELRYQRLRYSKRIPNRDQLVFLRYEPATFWSKLRHSIASLIS